MSAPRHEVVVATLTEDGVTWKLTLSCGHTVAERGRFARREGMPGWWVLVPERRACYDCVARLEDDNRRYRFELEEQRRANTTERVSVEGKGVLWEAPVDRCLAHLEDEPCSTCAAYKAAGL